MKNRLILALLFGVRFKYRLIPVFLRNLNKNAGIYGSLLPEKCLAIEILEDIFQEISHPK
jgi:hypothetical protein